MSSDSMRRQVVRRNSHISKLQVNRLNPATDSLYSGIASGAQGQSYPIAICGDARILPLASETVDLIFTSPPYWRKRDYKLTNQIGNEASPKDYVASIITALKEWRRVLKPTGSIFLNLGDTYRNKKLIDVPGLVTLAAQDDKWIFRNRIIWAKLTGMPDPAKDRLANRHEYIFHFTKTQNYYYDLFGYAEKYGNGSNPGDVWLINPGRNLTNHLAPFPEELVERILTLACPKEVCLYCKQPRRRIVRRTGSLNPDRPQARRAMELAQQVGLTDRHIEAIRATGISDAGKAIHFQTGAGRNSLEVMRLALEAKELLGGYFREFTFPQKESAGWTRCKCKKGFTSGVVLDPFMGAGTTLKVAQRMGCSAIGVDLQVPAEFLNPLNSS